MKKSALIGLAAAVVFSSVAVPHRSYADLKSLGNAITYPVKKTAHNTGKTLTEAGSHSSKAVNHAGQAVQYPVRKTGVNTSKTAHKAVDN